MSVGGTLYAKGGGALTLTVTTSNDTQCVDVTGSLTGHQTSTTGKSSWTFSFTAGAGEGIQTVTASASPAVNPNNKCTGQSQSPASASFVLDNTGPVVTGVVSPAPNTAGWNSGNVSLTWSATDAGSGVGSGPTPASDSVTANTAGTAKTSTATDRLGNTGTGSVTVKLDKVPPTISGTRSPAANTNGWNNTDVTASFSCSDALSGIKTCPGPTTFSSNGSGQAATGTASDNADNTSTATVSGINIDKTAPTLSGSPTTSPDSAGWYNGDVTIGWSCTDALSGIFGSCPASSTISGEGTGETATASVNDKAGNTTTATSSPAVEIDKTAPLTTATEPLAWNNTDVTVSLNASDALSGVAATHYVLDGGAQQTGTSVSISTEGVHSLQFWSVDNAGNEEATKNVDIKIDKTPPTISHTQNPAANGNGWNNTDVTVTFTCGDALSGVAACTVPQAVTTEGQSQPVTGSATDNAGNTATDPATVSVDKTPPSITGAPDRDPNANGWYNAPVTVHFGCADTLSGIAACSPDAVLGDGSAQSVTGTALDAAGNSTPAIVDGLNIDETAPVLTGTATTSPVAGGWYAGDVVINWTCTDALSGVPGDPVDSVISGEGDDLSATATCTDNAGNSTTTTVKGVKIDRTPPSTSVSVPDALASGWYAGAVPVTVTGVDAGSGVAATYYSVDGGTAQSYGAPFSFGSGGTHTLTVWSVDNAGNVEDNMAPGHSITIKIDNVPPKILGSANPGANAFGWNNTPVTVSFDCSDAESGLAGCTSPVTVTNAGAGQSVEGEAQDNAGNTASTTVSDINIDMTSPTLSGAATTAPNASGWYNGDVTIHWTGTDGLSGIDSATQPADSVITGEGADLGAGPAFISDEAGNIGSGSVSGIKIDRTPPTITGATVNDDLTPRGANAGWFNSAVRVHFSCGDGLSGVQECASDVVLASDGSNQAASGTATDMADNSAAVTVSGISIDSQAPKTTADLQCTSKNGYCNSNKATVVLSATDQVGLSGVKEIHYSSNNGSSWQVIAGASGSVNLNLNGSGKATVLFYSVDNAGNAETQDGVNVQYDTMAPSVTHLVTPAPNAAGWNNSNVTVHFDATDDSGGSGVDASTVTPDQTISTETAGTVVNGSAEDLAGNLGKDSVMVKLDKTLPVISGAPTTSPNGSGNWYTGPVTVHFTCSDQGAVQSGIATCPADVVLSTDGANETVTGTAVDNAGNASAVATVSGINIDSTKPTITSLPVSSGAIYTLGDPSIPTGPQTCRASDAGSGVASCVVTVTGGLPNGVGRFSFTATARDNAGNTTTQTGSYRVIYRWDGFLQPINDTAHQIDQTTSMFKAASTVPTKFQLTKADGSVVQSNTAPTWLTPTKGSVTTAAADETVYTDAPTSGGTYRYDSSGQQYIYNWGTAKNQAGYYWRIGVTLDDGQTYYVNIGLR